MKRRYTLYQDDIWPPFPRKRDRNPLPFRVPLVLSTFFWSLNLVYSALRLSTRAFFRSLISCMRFVNLRETKKPPLKAVSNEHKGEKNMSWNSLDHNTNLTIFTQNWHRCHDTFCVAYNDIVHTKTRTALIFVWRYIQSALCVSYFAFLCICVLLLFQRPAQGKTPQNTHIT